MFSIAHVILPMSATSPAEAIRASMAPFRRGGRGDLAEDMLAFHDETQGLRGAHEARFTFIDHGPRGGLGIEGGEGAYWYVDTRRVREEMRRRGIARWTIRFADEMDLEAFFDAYGDRLERHPATGGYGRWLNPLGRWDWWDLGGRFDGRIIGERGGGAVRHAASMSSGPSVGRQLLSNVTDAIADALGQQPAPEIEVLNDRNVELVEALLADAEAGRPHAFPGALVLPPGWAEDRLRWIAAWPEIRPLDALPVLGLAEDAAWEDVVIAAYRRLPNHWAAGAAFHH